MDEGSNSTPPVGDISALAEHLFREEAGKLVSILTGWFGIDRLQLAEDVVQEAMIRALKTWPYYGIPANPAGWLTQTARNLALDTLRREQNFQVKQRKIIATVENWGSGTDPSEVDETLKDHRLRLMFACCHPQVPREAQVTLALKTLCGLSPAEIAKAFLTTEAAVAKRITRARQRIKELAIPFSIPEEPELPERLESVLQTIYLMFNEGYKASSGEKLVRKELCLQAIELCRSLAEHPVGNQPQVHALHALMLLNGARLAGRVDPKGKVLRLEDQNRGLWDQRMVARGMLALARSAAGEVVTSYHLQAGVAAVHACASSYEATNWEQILHLYNRLIAIDDTPVVALNRAVAVGKVHGARAGLNELEKLKKEQLLESYHLLYAVMAEFEEQAENFEAAEKNLRKAWELATVPGERELLAERISCIKRGE